MFMFDVSCLTEKTLEKSMVNVTVGYPPQTYEMPTVGQWLVVQQRLDINVSFNQPWISYKEGLKSEIIAKNTASCRLKPIAQQTISQPIVVPYTLIPVIKYVKIRYNSLKNSRSLLMKPLEQTDDVINANSKHLKLHLINGPSLARVATVLKAPLNIDGTSALYEFLLYCTLCLKKTKRHNFRVHVSLRSAETLVRRGEIINHHSIAYSLSNISAKNYRNRLM